MTYSTPIAYFVYNRAAHSRLSLDALAANQGADQSRIFIFADGPKKDADEETLRKIEEVRRIIRAENRFAEVILREAPANIGVADSIIGAVTELTEKYGKVIVLEDDLVTKPGFLTYMNRALDLYESAENVYAVSGFAYPADYSAVPQTSFFLNTVCSWGWGTWRKAWADFEHDADLLLSKFKRPEQIREFNLGGFPSHQILEYQAAGLIDAWDVRFDASIFFKNGLVLYPKLSLLQNHGFDNSGVHCDDDDFFSQVPDTDFLEIEAQEPVLHRAAMAAVDRSFGKKFRLPLLHIRAVNKLKRIFVNLFN